MKNVLLIGCIILFIFCAPKKTTVETEGLEEVIVFGEEEEPVVEEEAIVAETPTEEVVVIPPPIEEPPMAKETPPPTAEEYVPPTAPSPPTPAPVKVYGFRVQIFASSTEKNALRVADDARSVFTENIYVDYVPPYYKVRVGNCLIREDGVTLKNKALSLGYYGAFIIETMITP